MPKVFASCLHRLWTLISILISFVCHASWINLERKYCTGQQWQTRWWTACGLLAFPLLCHLIVCMNIRSYLHEAHLLLRIRAGKSSLRTSWADSLLFCCKPRRHISRTLSVCNFCLIWVMDSDGGLSVKILKQRGIYERSVQFANKHWNWKVVSEKLWNHCVGTGCMFGLY